MDLVTQTLEENEVVVYLMTKYVDDINVAISLIPRGYGWEKEGRKWKLKWFAKREEEERERSAEQTTLEKLRWLGDRMVPGLNLLKTFQSITIQESAQCWTSRSGPRI